jgi:hypothetical protein
LQCTEPGQAVVAYLQAPDRNSSSSSTDIDDRISEAASIAIAASRASQVPELWKLKGLDRFDATREELELCVVTLTFSSSFLCGQLLDLHSCHLHSELQSQEGLLVTAHKSCNPSTESCCNLADTGETCTRAICELLMLCRIVPNCEHTKK